MPDKTKCMASKAAVDLHDHLKRDMMTLFSLEKVLQKKVCTAVAAAVAAAAAAAAAAAVAVAVAVVVVGDGVVCWCCFCCRC